MTAPPQGGTRAPGAPPPPNRLAEFVRRHPWGVAAVTGVITLTVLRPFTRHIPEPPPVLGSLPAVTVLNAAGAQVDLAKLQGGVWVFGSLCQSCGARATMTAALAALDARYQAAHREVTVHALEVELDSDRSGPLLEALHGAVGAPEHADALGSWPRIVLVDGQSHIRGAFGISELGLDEAYHRAVHVLKEAAALERTNGSVSESYTTPPHPP